MMKKILSLLALAVFTLGAVSCEAETDITETDALYMDLQTDASGEDEGEDDRGGS